MPLAGACGGPGMTLVSFAGSWSVYGLVNSA